MKKSLKIFLFIVFILILFFLFFKFSVSAQTASSLSDQINAQNQAFAGEKGAGFGESVNLKRMVVNIIEILLSLIATISVGMFFYAGFLYFTSQGEESKVEQAKKTIFYGVIGSALILMAYSISWFISYVFLEANPADTGKGVWDFESNVWVEDESDLSHPWDESTIPSGNTLIDVYNNN